MKLHELKEETDPLLKRLVFAKRHAQDAEHEAFEKALEKLGYPYSDTAHFDNPDINLRGTVQFEPDEFAVVTYVDIRSKTPMSVLDLVDDESEEHEKLSKKLASRMRASKGQIAVFEMIQILKKDKNYLGHMNSWPNKFSRDKALPPPANPIELTGDRIYFVFDAPEIS